MYDLYIRKENEKKEEERFAEMPCSLCRLKFSILLYTYKWVYRNAKKKDVLSNRVNTMRAFSLAKVQIKMQICKSPKKE